MNIYIASFFDTRARLFPIRNQLTAQGHRVVSQWLDAPLGTASQDGQRAEAIRDLDDLLKAQLLILDTLDENHRGGREVEWGLALSRMALRRWIVGPSRNVFHVLTQRQFATWEECLKASKEIA